MPVDNRSRSEYKRLVVAVSAKMVRYCPGCGSRMLDFDPLALDNTDTLFNPVFDVLCKNCGWSGDISPDIQPGDKA